MPRGGRRSGAGARPGNANALKTGEFSRRVKALEKAITQLPGVMELVSKRVGGDAKEMESMGYLLRYIGDALIRGAQRDGPAASRLGTDRQVLDHVVRRWQPRTPREELP